MPSTDTNRFHALDALRGGAMFLGVVLHAAMPVSPTLGSAYGQAASSHGVFDVVFNAIHGFRMELFFLLAGFFAELIFRRHGAEGLVRNRARRIAGPFVAGAILLFVVDQVLLRWAAWIGAPGADPIGAPPRPLHLWFLYYLLILEAVFVTWLAIEQRLRRWIDPLVSAVAARSLWLVPIAIVFSALLLARNPQLQFNDYGLVPVWLAHYAVFFAAGVLLHRAPTVRAVLTRRGWLFLVLAVPAFLISEATAGWLARCFFVSLYAWSATLGLLGLTMRWFAAPRTLVRSLADASYWVYLVHLPLIGAAHLLVLPLRWPAVVHFTLLLAVGFVVPLWSYERFIRGTWLGSVLGTSARPSRAAARSSATTG